MKIDASDPEFQAYARKIDYGYGHPRCNPDDVANFDPQLDNESALVAMNDGCYHDHQKPGRFVRPEDVPHHEAQQSVYQTASGAGSDWLFWVSIILVVALVLVLGGR